MFEKILNLLFKRKCFVCGKVENYLCFDCFYKKLILQKNCFICEDKDNGYNIKNCKKCRENIGVDGIISFFDYHDNKIKKMIHSFKFRSAFDIGKFLGEKIGDIMNKKYFLDGGYVIIPVPLSKKRFNFRGFNQSYVIASNMARIMNLDIYYDILFKGKNTKTQAGLSENDRNINLKSAFFVKYDNILRYNLYNKNIILVDDIITTGNTAFRCARELKLAGFNKVFVVTIART